MIDVEINLDFDLNKTLKDMKIDVITIQRAVENAIEFDFKNVQNGEISLYDEAVIESIALLISTMINDNIVHYHEIDKEYCHYQDIMARHAIGLKFNIGLDKKLLVGLIGTENMIANGTELVNDGRDIEVYVPLIVNQFDYGYIAEFLTVIGIGSKDGFMTPNPVNGKLLHDFMVKNDSIYRQNEIVARQEFDADAEKKGFKVYGSETEQEVAFINKMREEHYLDSMADRACGSGFNYCVYLLHHFGAKMHPNLEKTIQDVSSKMTQAIYDNGVIKFV